MSLLEDALIAPLSQNVLAPVHGEFVEQYDIGNIVLVGISVTRAIVTEMTILEETTLPMITALRSIAKEILMLVETTPPSINALRVLESEIVMLVERVLLMIRLNPTHLTLAGIGVIWYLPLDTLMTAGVRMRDQSILTLIVPVVILLISQTRTFETIVLILMRTTIVEVWTLLCKLAMLENYKAYYLLQDRRTRISSAA
jgi:hypothetical protein